MIRARMKVCASYVRIRGSRSVWGPGKIKAEVTSSRKTIGVRVTDHSMNDGTTAVQAPVKRSVQKRSLILDTAMRHFAENGYEAAHMGDMANQLGIAKGSVFQHFG